MKQTTNPKVNQVPVNCPENLRGKIQLSWEPVIKTAEEAHHGVDTLEKTLNGAIQLEKGKVC